MISPFLSSLTAVDAVCGACKTGKLIPLFTTRAVSRTGSKASTTSSKSTKSSSGAIATGGTNAKSTLENDVRRTMSKERGDVLESDDEDLSGLVRSLKEVELTG